MNTALFTLRAVQVGLSMEDMSILTDGEIFDIIIEAGNDSYKYPKKGTQEDINMVFGD